MGELSSRCILSISRTLPSNVTMIWNGTCGSLEDEGEWKYELPVDDAGEMGVLGVEHREKGDCVASGRASMLCVVLCADRGVLETYGRWGGARTERMITASG